jgi:hypothetical protein
MTPDGRSLLVVTTDGEQIAVTADERLRAAIRDDRSRLGQLEIDMESSLRPREIQARIRAGESLEDVAQAAGMPLERVRAFAGPVIAERDHVAGLALSSPVRRRGETAATRPLRATTSERLLARGIDPDDVTWDAWKRPDGLWAVTASYASGTAQHEAHFAYDLRGRFSVADDDEARWMIAETTPAHGPQPGRRKRVVDQDSEPTIDLDDDAARVRARAEDESSLADAPDYAPAELEQVDGVYDLVPPRTEMDVLYDMISGIDEDSVRIYTGLQNPVTQDRPAPAEPTLDEPEQLSLMDLVDDDPTRVVPRPDVRDPDPTPTAAVVPEVPAPAEPEVKPTAKRRRSKRASVPSWDEIMFGGPSQKT